MKRENLIALIIASICVIAASAQEKQPWQPVLGARLDMEVSVPSGGRNFYKTGAGFNAGLVLRMPMPRGFFFEPGLLFSYSAMTAKDLVSFDNEYFYEGAANLYTLRIPLMFGYTYSVNELWDLRFSTGPWINVNLSARQKLEPNFAAPEIVPDKSINLFKHGWKRVDALWGLRLSATFADHYTVGITAGVAFTPLARYGNHDKKVRIHRNSIAISLGYNF